MPTCAKCENEVRKVYDCDHTDFLDYCTECYTELHYYVNESPELSEKHNPTENE